MKIIRVTVKNPSNENLQTAVDTVVGVIRQMTGNKVNVQARIKRNVLSSLNMNKNNIIKGKNEQ